MAVDLKFYTENVMELEEIDVGQVRMNHGTIQPVKIKNIGTDRAKNVSIASGTLNTLEELKITLGDDALA